MNRTIRADERWIDIDDSWTEQLTESYLRRVWEQYCEPGDWGKVGVWVRLIKLAMVYGASLDEAIGITKEQWLASQYNISFTPPLSSSERAPSEVK